MEYAIANSDSESVRRAESVLNKYVEQGKLSGMNLFKIIKERVITPYRVYRKDMSFLPAQKEGDTPTYHVAVEGSEKVHEFSLHKHALSQMAGEVQIPLTFVNTLTNGAAWERRELSDLLQERFQKLDFKQRGGGSPRFINLAVGQQVRGFVSRSFKRHLRSGPIFEAFARACGSFGALPVETLVSDLAFTLRCVLQHVFELKRGKYVAIGLSCSNSDFGAGVFKIGLTAMDLQTGNITYLKSIKEERHVGSAERDTGSSEILSDETIQVKIHATQSEVRDVVAAGLHPDKVNELLELIRRSMDKEISWPRFVSYLQGKMSSEDIKELENILKDSKRSQQIADISYDVDENAIINLWWASSAVAEIAKKYDGEKKDDLQVAAGALLMRD